MTRPLSTREAADRLDVDIRTVQRWCRSEKLEGAYKFGGVWVVPPEAVEKLQGEQEQESDPS